MNDKIPVSAINDSSTEAYIVCLINLVGIAGFKLSAWSRAEGGGFDRGPHPDVKTKQEFIDALFIKSDPEDYDPFLYSAKSIILDNNHFPSSVEMSVVSPGTLSARNLNNEDIENIDKGEDSSKRPEHPNQYVLEMDPGATGSEVMEASIQALRREYGDWRPDELYLFNCCVDEDEGLEVIYENASHISKPSLIVIEVRYMTRSELNYMNTMMKNFNIVLHSNPGRIIP